MAREVAPKKQRVFITGNRVTKPVWNNADRINHANHFVPRSVILNSGRPNVNSVRPNVNTVRKNINSVRQNVNSVWSNINTGRTNVNSVRPRVSTVSSNVNTVRSRQPVPTRTSNRCKNIFGNMKRGFRRVPRPLLPAMFVVPPTPPTTQPIPSEATTIPPLSQPAPPTPIVETTTASPSPSPLPAHEPMEHTFEQKSTDQQPPTPRQEATTSQIMTRISDLEKQHKETKQTFGNAILTLVDRVKTLEVALKRKTKRVLLSDSAEEETEHREGKTPDLDPLVSLVKSFNTTPQRLGRREGKAPMTEEEETQASRKTKEQILQEEAGLAEAYSENMLEKACEKEEWPNKFHLASLITQRKAEEQRINRGTKEKEGSKFKFEAQSYTEEDWDTIRAKLEANA
ncbi:hypothetical protein Tco_0184460 [Tanacetum coccineum]